MKTDPVVVTLAAVASAAAAVTATLGYGGDGIDCWCGREPKKPCADDGSIPPAASTATLHLE